MEIGTTSLQPRLIRRHSIKKYFSLTSSFYLVCPLSFSVSLYLSLLLPLCEGSFSLSFLKIALFPSDSASSSLSSDNIVNKKQHLLMMCVVDIRRHLPPSFDWFQMKDRRPREESSHPRLKRHAPRSLHPDMDEPPRPVITGTP